MTFSVPTPHSSILATWSGDTDKPCKWSQRWYDDPPIGTIVLGHERVIYLGNGEWQPLDDGPIR